MTDVEAIAEALTTPPVGKLFSHRFDGEYVDIKSTGVDKQIAALAIRVLLSRGWTRPASDKSDD